MLAVLIRGPFRRRLLGTARMFLIFCTPEVNQGIPSIKKQQEGVTVAAHTLSRTVESPSKDYQGTPALATRPPEVDLDPHMSEMVAAWPEVHAMLTWWRNRHREVVSSNSPGHPLFLILDSRVFLG